METYTDAKPDGAKSVVYDDKGRVVEITLIRDNLIVDSWRYVYDGEGYRIAKLIAKPGARPHLKLAYDRRGFKTSEISLKMDGSLDDSSGPCGA